MTEELTNTCPECGEENPPAFPTCWQCQAELTPLVAPASRPAARSSARSRLELLFPAEPGPSFARVTGKEERTGIWLELSAVLLLFWLPYLLSGIYSSLHPLPAQGLPEPTWWDVPFDLLDSLGLILMILFLAWRAGNPRERLGLCRFRPLRELLWVPVLLSVAHLVNVLVMGPITVLWLDVGVPEWERNDPPIVPGTPYDLLYPLILLVSAAAEEVLYRGYLWSRLSELTGDRVVALVLSSVLFSLMHGYDPFGTLSLFVFAMLLGTIFLRTRNLWRVTLIHWGWNLAIYFTSP